MSSADYLGKYRLLRMIRSGSTCQVWEALEEKGDERRRVALKLLLRKFRTKKAEIEQMAHEARVGKSLDHENIIDIYEYRNINKTPFIAMELFTNKNLKMELRENYYELSQNMESIIMQCAKSLDFMASKKWVHCDVKPDNFLVDLAEKRVKLIDFSIAEKPKRGGLGGLFGKKTKSIRGTRSYMAPEQIRRQGVDERTDIYGLGCSVFELLTGRTPFTASNPDDLLRAHLSAPVPNVISYSGATKEMGDLLMRMMAKKAEKRPQTFDEIIRELKKISVYRAGHRPKKEES